MTLPKSQKAVVTVGKGKAELVPDRPIPKLRDDYILVKTVAVAINPTDWKHVDALTSEGSLCGCDYSGYVEEIGSAVTKPFQKGDKVFGFVHGGDAVQYENGAFAEYIVAKGDLQTHLPPNLSFEQAATLGVGISTVGQALYQSLQLPLPTEPAKEPFPVLIYGGSTATGTLAIQFARLSGLEVITTSSPRNFELCKSLGASHTLDYNDPSCAEQIRKITNNKLEYAFDTISEERTAAICVAAMNPSKSGVRYTNLLPVKKYPRDDIYKGYTLAYTTVGEYFRMGPTGPEFPARKEDFEYAKMFWAIAEKLLAEGKIKVHPMEVRGGGLKGAIEGMDLLRQNKVSGKKLVYRVDETP